MCPQHERIEKGARVDVNPAVLEAAIRAREKEEFYQGPPPLPVPAVRAQVRAALGDEAGTKTQKAVASRTPIIATPVGSGHTPPRQAAAAAPAIPSAIELPLEAKPAPALRPETPEIQTPRPTAADSQRAETRKKILVLLQKLAQEEKSLPRKFKSGKLTAARVEFQKRALLEIAAAVRMNPDEKGVTIDKMAVWSAVSDLENENRGSLTNQLPRFMKSL